MKADQFPSAMNKLSELITAAMPAINEKVALDGAAMVKDRIINTGINANGTSLGTYSERELPSFFFKDKALNNSGQKAYEDAKKNGEGISYKKWREANNRTTDHVTLSFSGTTMRDVGVRKQLIEGTKVITSIGAKNTKIRSNGDSTETIVDEYLQPRYGNFMQPNDTETKILKNNLENEIKKLINESFK